MTPDEENQNKIEIFRPGDARLERQRTPRRYVRLVEREDSPDLFRWWKIACKRRRTVLTAFLALFLFVLAGTVMQKPIYRAKALIEIDRENPNFVTSQELLQLDEVSDTYLETQYKVLTSEDLAGRVIAELGLEQNPEFAPTAPSSPWSKIAGFLRWRPSGGKETRVRDQLAREAVLAQFEERLDIRPVRRSRAVEIRFDCQDPDLAARVVNALTENYIQKNLEARWEATQKTSEWLSQQLQDLKAKLEKSEGDLQKYAARNGLLYLETDKGNTESIFNQSLRELQEEFTRAQADRYQKESLFRLVQAGDYGSLPGVFDDHLLQDLTERLADLQREHAQLAATFTEDYPKVKEIQSQIAVVQTSLERERWRAAQKISNDYFAALRREKLVEEAFTQKQGEANQVAEKSVQYGILNHEVDSNKGLYDGLLQRLKEAGVTAGLKASNIRIVDPGTASYQPVAPIVPLNLGLAAFLGLGLGIGIAWIQEKLDQTIRNAEDVNHFLGIPAIGFIPTAQAPSGRRMKRGAREEERVILGVSDSNSIVGDTLVGELQRNDGGIPAIARGSPFFEAFRELRTSVVLSGTGRFANSILVTSAQPGEGKTTVAVNLAVSLAQLGQPVLLVDADLRRPSLHKYFPDRGAQLSTYLEGLGAWQELVCPTSISRLSVLHGGPAPENPSELISSERLRALIRESIATYRFVVFDSPPLLTGADSRILGSMVGATILVVKCAETPRQVVQYAESQAQSVGTNLIGIVLNHADPALNVYSHYARGHLNEAGGAA
jgi:polysaccharide biosynthesis transport protein